MCGTGLWIYYYGETEISNTYDLRATGKTLMKYVIPWHENVLNLKAEVECSSLEMDLESELALNLMILLNIYVIWVSTSHGLLN